MASDSDVARILAQIESEYVAGRRGLHDFAEGTAKHESITVRMENMGRLHEQLSEIVGGAMPAMKLIDEKLQHWWSNASEQSGM